MRLLILGLFLCATATAQTIDFTAVTADGTTLTGTVTGNTMSVSGLGTQTLTTATAYGQIGALNPGGYIFATGNMCLDFSEAVSAQYISPGVMPTSLNPANYFSQFTYTNYTPSGSALGGITAMVTSAVVSAGSAISAVSAPVARAPEIDPSGAGVALTLLLGGLAVARGRVRR